ncbi:MAG: DUF934 domain-containing protein [Alphaproteobacteria bacterium]|nr:DUF934 domain-containing protein [Alphaproteobacteria bacterium]
MPLLKLFGSDFAPALEEPLQEVSLEDWCDNPQAHADATALVIENDIGVEHFAEDLSSFRIIILNFPTFKDGRAYSQARLLRERFGYTGEIRARGDVLRDQALFMVRCGFDAFEFADEDAAAATAALAEFSFAYQPAADRAEPVWRRRLDRPAAA